MKVSTVLGRVTVSAVSLGGWSFAAYRWNIPFFYYLGVVFALLAWLKPPPPLPKIGDYEDDDS